jgi:hypothetical protein
MRHHAVMHDEDVSERVREVEQKAPQLVPRYAP